MNTTFTSIALLTFGATSALVAQSDRVVPLHTATTEGSTLSVYPFGYTNPRCQQIWSGSSITTGTAVINGISLRHDTSGTAAVPGRSYTGVTFAIGTTTKTPASISTTFSSNITSSLTTVVSGAWNLPAQPAPTVQPAPFNIDFSWTTPFIYMPTSGDLILDITLPGTIGKSSYFVDAEPSKGVPGAAEPFGTSGKFSTAETFALDADASTLSPGGTLAITCGTFSKSYAGGLVVGLSDYIWSGVNLPLDLGIIGAQNNNLYVSMDLIVGFSTTQTPAGYMSALKGAIPNTTIHNGLRFYTQAYYADAGANGAGLVTTHGLTLRIADPNAGPETNLVGNYDSTGTTGNISTPPIARFVGIFP